MASTYLTRTPSGTGSQTKFTFSFWWKNNCNFGSDKCFFSSGLNSSNYFMIRTTGNEQLELLALDNGNATMRYKPTRFYRDNNAWYHIVIAVDTTQSGGNRLKWYTNGVRETAFDLNTEPNQSSNILYVNDTTTHCIGRKNVTSDKYMDGTLSHYHFIDGTAYDASAFGSTDATTGEWKINTNPNVTYGNNGFFVLKDGNSVTDQSGNSNNFTVAGGTFTKTEDNPSNVFATLNALYYSGGTVTYSAGNNRFAEADGQWKTTFSTLGASSGKYYAEFKCNGNYMFAGVADYNVTKSGIADRNFASTTYISEQGYGYYNHDGTLRYRGSETSYGASYGSGDIVQVALDCDNNKVFFGKNGTWQNSADPTSAGTGFSMTATNATYVFAISVLSDEVHCNFGNGYFNTTAVSSAGTNASNLGIFEYDVPSGYTALCTKGLNE
jgi:hypothetical protein